MPATPKPGEAALTTATPAKAPVTATPATAAPTPEATAAAAAVKTKADEASVEKFTSRLRRGVTSEPAKEEPAKTPEEIAAAEAKVKADEAKVAAEAKAKEEGTTVAPAKAAAPAKKTIRVAKGYEGVVTDEAATKLTQAAEKLTNAAEKVASATTAAPLRAAEPPVLELSADEKREMAALAVLVEVCPDKPEYKGIEQRAEKYLRELPAFETEFDKKFADKWERKNADKDFENDAARESAFNEARTAAYERESAGFRAKFKIDFEDADLRRAEVELAARPLKQELTKTKEQLQKIAERENVERIAEFAQESTASALSDFATQAPEVIGKEIEGVFKEDGTLDMDKLATVEDGDIIGEVLTDRMQRAKNFAINAAHYLSGPANNPNNEVHKFCVLMEKQLSEAKAKNADGKLFARGGDFAKMTAAEQAKHFVLDVPTVIALANDTILSGAKADIDAERARVKAFMERRGIKPGAPAEGKEKEKAAGGNGKPQSVTTTTSTPAAAAAQQGDGSAFLSRMRTGSSSGVVGKT